ncbi:MAG: serine/threonine protein kinase [Archangium sp.]
MSVITHSGENEEVKTAEVAADALDALVGQTIDGRFRIVDVIGKGAMGKVYRAVQVPLNRAVALKVLDSTYGAGREESFKQRFLVEAALHAKLNHPNTVRVVDYGSTKDGLFFLVMEYLDGDTLEQTLKRGPLPWHRVLSIGLQMARALREAHELGVVHRDLKPANVVMLHSDDDTDFAKVLDFGLVKSFVDGHELEGRAITQQGMLMGSPPYMAPEQGEKNRADPRSDIYSLGTMLFEMLTGKPPYTGTGALDIILKHVNEPIPALVTPQKYEPPPEALKTIVTRCLAKSPMDRFQSMDELILALQDVSVPVRATTNDSTATEAAVPIVHPPTTDEAPAFVPAAQPRSNAPLLVGFFVAVVAGVLGTWTIVKPAPPPTRVNFHVDSTPAGANVLVDGKSLGVTPIDLEQSVGAGLTLRLEKEGFAPLEVKLTAHGGRVDFATALTELPKREVVPPPEPVKVEASAPLPSVEEKKADPPSIEPLKKIEKKRRLVGVKSASKLEDDDAAPVPAPAPPPSKSELKRPDPQP